MIFDVSDTGGLVRLGPLALLWQNPDSEYPGFTTFSFGNYSLEFGEIDAGNGIFLTTYFDGDILQTLPIVKL